MKETMLRILKKIFGVKDNEAETIQDQQQTDLDKLRKLQKKKQELDKFKKENEGR